MKKNLFAIIALSIVLVSCSKNEDDVMPPKPDQTKTYFRIKANNKVGDTSYSRTVMVFDKK